MSFDLFHLAPSLNIDEALLRKTYLEIQKENHPDFGSDLQLSEKANHYYKILSKPLSRTAHLITDYHHFDLNINKLDNDFLMEMMEIGESIEDSNSPENKIEQESLLNKYKQDFDIEFSEIKSEWGQTEISKITPELWMKLILWYQKQRYIERLRKLLNDISEI